MFDFLHNAEYDVHRIPHGPKSVHSYIDTDLFKLENY